MEVRGEPFLEIDGETITERDIQALRAIAEYGSMYKAASELGRSYARIQTRISELEETLDPLVTRVRGGEGGGGSTLTENGQRLVAKFARLREEISGLERTEESVFSGVVVERGSILATIATDAGEVQAMISGEAEHVDVSVRSDAVALTNPAGCPNLTDTSVRNQFRGVVKNIEREGEIGRITVDVGAEEPLRTLITQESLTLLDLAIGDDTVASFKATASRAVPRTFD